jgi:hypothetical protein
VLKENSSLNITSKISDTKSGVLSDGSISSSSFSAERERRKETTSEIFEVKGRQSED